MKTKTIKQYVSILIAVLFMAMIALTSIFQVSKVFAYSEGDNAYDETFVESDLGQEIMEKGYEMSFDGTAGTAPSVYSFLEYCFSIYEEVRNENYGLYLYIYNPGRIEFSEAYGANTITMATRYNEIGEPTNYEVLPLKLCDYSTGRYDYLFYKFRVMELDEVLKNAVSYNTENQKRRYDVSQVDLLEVGEPLPKMIEMSTTYYASGYAKGLATESAKGSTLKIDTVKLETIVADVLHANYRTKNYKNFVCDEINTVYFAVPEHFFTQYGALQKIKAQWYEYKTKPVFATTDQEAYDWLSAYIGKDIGNEPIGPEPLPYSIYWEMHARDVGTDGMQADTIEFGKSYNHFVDFWGNVNYGLDSTHTPTTRIDWLKTINAESNFEISTKEIMEYMQWYTNKYPAQDKTHGAYASGLFADSIDADRVQLLKNPNDKMGLIVQEIDAGDQKSLTYNEDQSFWDKIFNRVDTVEQAYNPIVVLEPGDIDNLYYTEFGRQYLISESQSEAVYNNIKNMLDTKLKDDETQRVVMFRFAQTDYYCSNAIFDYMKDYQGVDPDMNGINGYVAQETMFLEYKTIQLTFRQDGKEKVVPVVSDPIDIINAFEGLDDVDYDKGESGGCASGCAGGWRTFLTVISVLVCVYLVSLLFRFGKRIWRWFNGE